MNYVVLLRGINVGKSVRVEMKRLKSLLEEQGLTRVSTYINSGNVLLESDRAGDEVALVVSEVLREEWALEVPTLVLTMDRMRAIAEAIPGDWRNDDTFKTDVAYLFPELDSPEVMDGLPVVREWVDMRYVPGALFWRVARADYNRSRLNRIVGTRHYSLMTVRNVNTARVLGGLSGLQE